MMYLVAVNKNPSTSRGLHRHAFSAIVNVSSEAEARELLESDGRFDQQRHYVDTVKVLDEFIVIVEDLQ